MFKQPIMLCVKFLKFLCINTFKKKLEFNLAKGRVFKRNLTDKDRLMGTYWKVKDPFIKEYNYAKDLKLPNELSGHSKRRLKDAITSMTSLIESISNNTLQDWVNTPVPALESVQPDLPIDSDSSAEESKE
jgi:hypothetical protein